MPLLYKGDEAKERHRGIGMRLRCARMFVEPNRAEFARKANVDVSTVRKIEQGDRSGSRLLLEHFAHLLRVSMEYLEWGSLSGVDPEMAAYLRANCQDELAGRSGSKAKAAPSHAPRKLAAAHSPH